MKKLRKKFKQKWRKPFRTALLYVKNIKHLCFLHYCKKKQIVICFDGHVYHGGLVDRLKGIISFFHIAQAINADFKIFFKHPFPLEYFLEPQGFNWVASENDLRWNPFNSRILYLMEEFGIDPIEMMKKSKIKKFIVYCNIDYLDKIFPEMPDSEKDKQWGAAFKQLFRSSSILKAALTKENFAKNRIVFHTRFTSILGDFKDTSKKTLPEEAQLQLMEKCKSAIEKTIGREEEKTAYVFSDSIKFLNHVSRNPNIRVTTGEPKHLELSGENTYDVHLKTFLDFMAISGSRKIFLIKSKEMYNSNFSRYASKINQVEFITINV